MLSALYKLHDQVTTTNFVTAVDILMVKFPLYIGIHRLLEKFFQELVTRSGIEKISDMVSTALSVFERAEQNVSHCVPTCCIPHSHYLTLLGDVSEHTTL